MRVRDHLRWIADYDWTCQIIAGELQIEQASAEILINELSRLAYIEPCEISNNQQYYHVTLRGSAFSLASAARPLTRKTADKKLKEFLDRVHAVNDNPELAYRVHKVAVFGSYLTEKERINDIDIAVELVHREADPHKCQAIKEARINKAIENGRHFATFIDEVIWPYNEILLFLKARSRAISLDTTDDPILKQTPSKIIFEEQCDSQNVHSDIMGKRSE